MSLFQDKFVGVWSQTYVQKLFFKLAMVLLIIGGINWLLVGVFDVNLVRSIFGKGTLATFVYVAVGISALAVMIDRDTYLPFLGPMVAPCSVLQNREPPGASKEITINIELKIRFRIII